MVTHKSVACPASHGDRTEAHPGALNTGKYHNISTLCILTKNIHSLVRDMVSCSPVQPQNYSVPRWTWTRDSSTSRLGLQACATIPGSSRFLRFQILAAAFATQFLRHWSYFCCIKYTTQLNVRHIFPEPCESPLHDFPGDHHYRFSIFTSKKIF